jgi:hypothetical protein
MVKSEIVDQLVILAESFGLSFNDARMEIYVDCLTDVSLEKLKSGIVRLIKTRTFAGNLPSVAEIREASLDGDVPIETLAALAWETAAKAIHDVGPYESPSFADPIITRIIIAWGGWIDFGNWPAEQTRWKRKEFMDLYKAYAATDQRPYTPDHLIGISEGNNRDQFPEFVPEPIQIGEWTNGKKWLT